MSLAVLLYQLPAAKDQADADPVFSTLKFAASMGASRAVEAATQSSEEGAAQLSTSPIRHNSHSRRSQRVE